MRTSLFFGLLLASTHLDAARPASADTLPAPVARKVDFAKDVFPLFRDGCFRCHGPEKQKGKYRMDSRVDAFKSTSEWGPAIKAGDSRGSAIVQMMGGLIDEMLMPPPGGKPGESDPFTAEQIGIVRAWIDQGAAWPDGPIQVPVKVLTFQENILPTLRAACGECHSSAKAEGGFSVESLGSVVKGGTTYGGAVKPGDAEHSPLLSIVGGRDEDIPLPQKHRLPDKFVQVLREWIKTGAKD